MKIFSCLFIFIIALFNSLAAQFPGIEWQHTIGGTNYDNVASMDQTADGGYILGGSSMSDIGGDKSENTSGPLDFWLVKTDATGNIEWENTIKANGYDQLNAVQQTIDGGYIIGGSSDSDISGDKTEANMGLTETSDYWVLKLDSSGAIEWQNTIGGEYDDYLMALDQTADGGYIVGGISDSPESGDKTEANLGAAGEATDYWILKLDASGNIEWQNTIGGDEIEELAHLLQTSDGGYLLCGMSTSDISDDKNENNIGVYDYWIVKLDGLGNIEWQNTIGGTESDRAFSAAQTSDEGYIIGGFSESDISGDKTETSAGDFDYWVVKLDDAGSIEWQNTIGGAGPEYLRTVIQTMDNEYMLSGISGSGISGDKLEASYGGFDYWIIKLNTSGEIEWQKALGGSFEEGFTSDLQQNPDLGYVFAFTSSSGISGDKTEPSVGGSDYWMVKLFSEDCVYTTYYADTDGDHYGDLFNTIDTCLVIPDGYVSDSTDCDDTNEAIYPGAPEIADGLDNNCNDTIDEGFTGIEGLNTSYQYKIFPNPADDLVQIELYRLASAGEIVDIQIADPQGRIIIERNLVLLGNYESVVFNMSHFPAGIYAVAIILNDHIFMEPLVLK